MFWVCLTSLVFVRIVGLHQQPPILQNQITPATLPSWSVPNRNEFRPQWPVMQSAIPQPAPGPVTMQSWVSPQHLQTITDCSAINTCLQGTKKPWWQTGQTLEDVCRSGNHTETVSIYHDLTLFNIVVVFRTIADTTTFISTGVYDKDATFNCGVSDLDASRCVWPIDAILEENVLVCFKKP